MNNRIISVLLLGLSLYIVFGCREVQYDILASYRVFYINETTDTICVVEYPTISSNSDTSQILPNNTLILEASNVRLSTPPNINNFPIGMLSYYVFYKNANQCDYGTYENGGRARFLHIENYEDRKEISPLNFEFTYQFTEEVKAEAGECL